MLIGSIILLVIVVDKLLQQVLVEMTCGTTAAEKAGVVFIDEAERSSTLAEKHEEGNVNVIALFCRSVPFLIRSARMRESGDVVVCLCVKSMWIVLFLWHTAHLLTFSPTLCFSPAAAATSSSITSFSRFCFVDRTKIFPPPKNFIKKHAYYNVYKIIVFDTLISYHYT